MGALEPLVGPLKGEMVVQDAPRSYRTILIVGGPKLEVQKSLSPHQVVLAKSLEASFEDVVEKRPDLVLYFAQGKEDRLEEHVITWLIEGFRGKVVVLDPANSIHDADVLIEGQVIDEYLSGPLSPTRLIAIIKSHLGYGGPYNSPRAITTFDLFRNLYERGLNAIFFFSEDLSRCLVANVAAEQLMTKSLYELRQMGLSDVCHADQLEETVKVVRRATRSYYDVKGSTAVSGRRGSRIDIAFSCGWFNFGRMRFLKMEFQTPPTRRREDVSAVDQAALWGAVDQSLKEASGRKSHSLSLIWCRIKPANPEGDRRDESDVMDQVHQALLSGTRRGDTVVRANRRQFAVLLPGIEEERTKDVAERLRKKVLALAPIQEGKFLTDLEIVRCPPEAFSFMRVISQPSC